MRQGRFGSRRTAMPTVAGDADGARIARSTLALLRGLPPTGLLQSQFGEDSTVTLRLPHHQPVEPAWHQES